MERMIGVNISTDIIINSNQITSISNYKYLAIDVQLEVLEIVAVMISIEAIAGHE